MSYQDGTFRMRSPVNFFFVVSLLFSFYTGRQGAKTNPSAIINNNHYDSPPGAQHARTSAWVWVGCLLYIQQQGK
jgi:hypothetical protein